MIGVMKDSDKRALAAARDHPGPLDGYVVRIHRHKIWIGGNIQTQWEADEFVETINALKTMLPISLSTETPDEN